MDYPALEVRGVSFCYPDKTPALIDVSFNVSCGSTLAVIGPNGAGKSTLLLCCNGIIAARGQIKVFGCAVEENNLARVRAMAGMVFQDPDNQLFMPTVFDDVAFGPLHMGLSRDRVQDAVVRALKQVDMLHAIKRSSHHLSFGERKRICLATVLSMDPRILLLDEPTANLDPKHRRQLIGLLANLAITKIIATHDLELVRELCTGLVLLDQGRLVIAGEVDTILSQRQLMETHGLEVPVSLSGRHIDRSCDPLSR